jgi:hypothetical protein
MKNKKLTLNLIQWFNYEIKANFTLGVKAVTADLAMAIPMIK